MYTIVGKNKSSTDVTAVEEVSPRRRYRSLRRLGNFNYQATCELTDKQAIESHQLLCSIHPPCLKPIAKSGSRLGVESAVRINCIRRIQDCFLVGWLGSMQGLDRSI